MLKFNLLYPELYGHSNPTRAIRESEHYALSVTSVVHDFFAFLQSIWQTLYKNFQGSLNTCNSVQGT